MESCVPLISAGRIDYITQGRYDYSKDQINSSRNAFAQQRTAACLMCLTALGGGRVRSACAEVLTSTSRAARDFSPAGAAALR